MLTILSIRVLSMQIIVVLNSQSDNSNMPVMSGSGGWSVFSEKQSSLAYLKMVPFPYPQSKHKGIFLKYFLRTWVKILEVNLTKVWMAPYTCTLTGVFHSAFCTMSLQQLVNYNSGSSTGSHVSDRAFLPH